jgi:hypothetical protein
MNRFRAQTLFVLSFAIVLAAVSVASAIETESYIAAEAGAGRFALATSGTTAPLLVSADDWPGVVRAAKNLQADIGRVTGVEPQLSTGEVSAEKSLVLIGTLGKSPLIDKLVADKKLVLCHVQELGLFMLLFWRESREHKEVFHAEEVYRSLVETRTGVVG